MRVALIQAKASMNQRENWDRVEEMLKDAVVQGARVACLQECFATWFFAQRIDPKDQGRHESKRARYESGTLSRHSLHREPMSLRS